MKPLVSILIPAFNAEKWISESIESAIRQTWPHKEIIVVDDGSTDRTAEIADRFRPQITLVQTKNQGLSAAVNCAFRHSRGDYIQELDSDDLLAPDKIERQFAALKPGDSKRIVLSSQWSRFYFRTNNTHFVKNSLCEDLLPAEWLYRKLSENLFMQNATWLVSREVAESAGPWNEQLHYDQDGEYFARVLLASEGTRFVPGTGVYYRAAGPNCISFIGTSDRKKESLLISMKLHIQYLRSLEDSERVRMACVTYLQNWYNSFLPGRPDLAAEAESLAAELGGQLHLPQLRWKYAWMKPIFGLKAAEWAQTALPQSKAAWIRYCDETMYRIEKRRASRIPLAARSISRRD